MRSGLYSLLSVVVFLSVCLSLFSGSIMLLLKEKYECTPFEWKSEKAEAGIELIKIAVDISSADNFRRLNDHEIVFKNKLYDVVNSFVKGNTQYFYCINDIAEEKYLEQIRQCNEANLDYLYSKNNSAPPSVKFFTLKNRVKEALEKNLPVFSFTYSIETFSGEMKIALNRVHPPPEHLLMRLDFCKCEARSKSLSRINPPQADWLNTPQLCCGN